MAKKSTERRKNINRKTSTLTAGTSATGLPSPTYSPPAAQDPGLVSGISADEKADNIAWADSEAAKEKAYAEAGSEGASVSIKGASKDAKNKKRQALTDFFMSKGLTQEEAIKKANSVTAAGGKTSSEVKGFTEYLNQNPDKYGLSVTADGKIKASLDPVQYNESNPDIREGVTDIQKQGIETVKNLQGAEAGDVGEAIAFRRGLRNTLGSTLDAQGTEGFTQQQANALEQQKQAAMTDYSDTFNANVGNVINRLNTGGALRSSLLGENLRQGAFKGYGQFMQGLQGQMADQGQRYLNDASNRQQTRVQNIVAGMGSGGAGSSGGLYNNFYDPSKFGLATDPQQAELMLSKEELDQRNRAGVRGHQAGTRMQGTLQPNSPGMSTMDWVNTGVGVAGTLGMMP